MLIKTLLENTSILKDFGNEDSEMIDRIGKYLICTKAKYYTCHSTGIESYGSLKPAMGDSIDYLPAGNEIII